MQRTASQVRVLVGEDKYPITLTDSAVEAVQGEAAGRAVTGFADVWGVVETVEAGDGFDALELPALLELRDHLQKCAEAVDVLIECRPLDELESDDDGD